MKQPLIRLNFTSLLFLVAFATQAQSKSFFENADKFFNKYIDQGQVDYAQLVQGPEALNKLVASISTMSLSGKEEEEKAFYINAYNILVIKTVVDHYPITSPLDVNGFFDHIKYNVAGSSMTLSHLENKVIRKNYNDPRVHFVLVCAALSCPELAGFAYTPGKLDKQLEEQTKKALNDPDFVRIKKNSELVLISKIFDWYSEDFKATGQSKVAYINTYRSKDDSIPEDYKVDYYPYSWKLNEKKKYR